MTALALYTTVWTAIVLFVAAEAMRERGGRGSPVRGPAWVASAAGAALLAIHIILAFDARHEWSHAAAVRAAEEQTRSVYGMSWKGAVWMNYFFLALWITELAWWGAAPHGYFRRSRIIAVLSRGFYLVILSNAAVIFAAPSRRFFGATILIVLLWAWRGTFRTAGSAAADSALRAQSSL